jgi:segregation and condensation protein A
MKSSSYLLKLDIFEGPLDLLLYLIKEQKMDIYDIPVAEITKQYLQYIEMIQDLNLDLAGEYLIMAAELTRIKSKTLLPRDETEEESLEDEGEDPREELTRKLLEYQRYKEAAFELRRMESERQQIYSRSGGIPPAEDEEFPEDTNVFDLLKAFQKVINQKKVSDSYELKVTDVSVADKLDQLLEILNSSESVTFFSLFTVLNSKAEIVATFLGLLELIRLKLVRIQQSAQFETIRIYLAVKKDEQEAIIKDYREAQDLENEKLEDGNH